MSELVRVAVRMYQVGFGDCFLLSFEYDGPVPPDNRRERHMLVDFGRNRTPHHGGNMTEVARSIKDRTNGRLDVIVATHRHEDHVSAFGQKAVAKIIGECNPRLIVRSWTENPALGTDAGRPSLVADRRYLAGIDAARAFAAQVAAGFSLDNTAAGRRLRTAAQTDIANRAAVDQLTAWGEAAKYEFLHVGRASTIGRIIPGVRFELAGPPLPSDYPRIARQVEDHPDEFWNLWRRRLPQALAGAMAVAEDELTDGGHGRARRDRRRIDAPGAIGPVGWLTDKVRRQQVPSLLRIVRWLDDVMNNTSVVLLVRAGDRRLLFPGDAQLESWRWITTDSPRAGRTRRQLAQLDLYKVGHHGSRNATPRSSLYRLWTPDGGPVRPVLSLMSTREDVYGESDDTDVPNPKLITGLSTAPMRLLSTLQDKDRDDGILAYEVAALARGPGRFEVQAPVLRPG